MSATHPLGRIGPNAIIQVTDALRSHIGADPAGELVRAAGLGGYLDAPPRSLVDECEVIALHSAVREWLAPPAARSVATAAGRATGDYLLANRIPRLAQRVLHMLPAPLASRVLLAAISKHSWTFAGSGSFSARAGRPVVITIGDCPICRGSTAAAPLCDYYSATFQRLFRELVHPRASVTESDCIASGAPVCRFEIDWR